MNNNRFLSVQHCVARLCREDHTLFHPKEVYRLIDLVNLHMEKRISPETTTRAKRKVRELFEKQGVLIEREDSNKLEQQYKEYYSK